MKRFGKCLCAMMLLGLALTGCTNYEKTYKENTVVLKSSGSIVEVGVEDYSGLKVKAEDVTNYVKKQIDDYNKEEGSGKVKKKTLSTDNMSKAVLVLKYKDVEAYNDFNYLECVNQDYGSVEKEVLKGDFFDAKGKSADLSKFKDTEKVKVFTTSEATRVVVPKEILYYNDEVTVKKDVIKTSGKKTAVIIYK